MSQGSGETSHGLPLARVGWLKEAKRQPLSAPGRRFPPQGLRLLGWYDLYQGQHPVDKSGFPQESEKFITPVYISFVDKHL